MKTNIWQMNNKLRYPHFPVQCGLQRRRRTTDQWMWSVRWMNAHSNHIILRAVKQARNHRLPSFLPPSPLTAHRWVMSSGESVNMSVCAVWRRTRRGVDEWTDLLNEMMKQKKRRKIFIFHQSIHQKSHSFNFLSVSPHSAHTRVCVCDVACVGGV